MKCPMMLMLFLAGLSTADAQLRITSVEKLPLDSSRSWSSPRFSPNGQSIFFTQADNSGIWEYSLATKTVRSITTDPQSGGSFTISSDGTQVVYRRTTYDRRSRTRKQEIVLHDLSDGSSRVVTSGRTVSTPVFSHNTVLYSVQGGTQKLSSFTNSREVVILGIEATKIALSRGGAKVLLDPFKNGSYIWPSLSPYKELIVAYEMDRGTFVCDVGGKVISTLGRRNAAVWSRSGRWLIYMDDRDDGHRIMSSDLHAITPDGGQKVRLTFTDDVMEVYPHCSPTEDKIVCATLEGGLYVLTYEERE